MLFTNKFKMAALSSPRRKSEEYGDQDVYDFNDDDEFKGQQSEEDTDDASEGEEEKEEGKYTEIKEQMYQDKLAQLKKQLAMLQEATLPEYIKKLRRIEMHYEERLRQNDIWYQYECELIEEEYKRDKKNAAIDFEERKTELKDCLLQELEDKRKQIDYERGSMELSNDHAEVKPPPTRKLRPRPHDPIQTLPEKRRKPSPVSQLMYCLSEEDIDEDLKIIMKISGKPIEKKAPLPPTPPVKDDIVYEARIDDGRLYFEKKWFLRGQAVFIESKEMGKTNAVISAVGTAEIWLRKVVDNTKLKIAVRDIQRGKYFIRKRTL